MKAMDRAHNVGVPIPPKPDFTPNPIATQTDAITLQKKLKGSKVSSTGNSI
jgi:hypothetical protein